MRKILTCILVLALVLTFSSCGKKNKIDKKELDTATQSALAGGWTLAEPQENVLPDEVLDAFDKAQQGFVGMGFKPVAYIGSQVVAGMNYAVLCQGTTVTASPVTALKVAVIYKDLEGNAVFNNVADFEITDYTAADSADKTAVTGLAGGWSYDSVQPVELADENAKKAFETAFEGITGVGYEPLALLGTQVVAGTNYAFLCKATTVTKDPVSVVKVVTVYQDLSGHAAITSIKDVDIADFNK